MSEPIAKQIKSIDTNIDSAEATIQSLQEQINKINAPGQIKMRGLGPIPDGWIPMIGQTKEELPQSLIDLGYTSLPDTRGRFPEGNYEMTEMILKEAGLPDHSHTLEVFWWDESGVAEEGRGSPDFGHHRVRTTSKASASNAIYGKSSTVQPASFSVVFIIKV